jgi:hypothetical protein
MNEDPDKKLVKFLIVFFVVAITYISCTTQKDKSKPNIECHTEYDGRAMPTICEVE